MKRSMEMATIEDFLKLEIQAGTIIHAEINSKARMPAYILNIDFGDEVGVKGSSAQLCENYTETDLIGKQIIAVTNFPTRKVAGFKSEVLVLAVVCNKNGTVLVIMPQEI
jgi:tRNA-binding protein